MSELSIDVELDTRGLNCPLPILKAKKSLASMTSGQLLRVVATDTGSLRDFQAFCKQTGNDLVEQQTLRCRVCARASQTITGTQFRNLSSVRPEPVEGFALTSTTSVRTEVIFCV